MLFIGIDYFPDIRIFDLFTLIQFVNHMTDPLKTSSM